jgi:protein PET117
MSRASKLTLLLTTTATAGIVYFVHWAQQSEKAAMHAGVVRDMQNQALKSTEALRIQKEREADFAMQRKLEEEYRKIQAVSDGGGKEGVSG